MMHSNEEEAQKEKNVEIHWNPFEKLFRMRRETPEFKRCCFCIPLRRGLIGWGYIKVVLNMAAISLLLFLTMIFGPLAIVLIEIIFLMTDVAFNIILIVGGHQKNIKFVKITYIYSMVWLGLALVGFCWLAYADISLALRLMAMDAHYSFILSITLPGFCVQFAILFVQIYWILLIRSLMIKLQGQTVEFQFTNPAAAEAQCTVRPVTHTDRTDEPDDAGEYTTSGYVNV